MNKKEQQKNGRRVREMDIERKKGKREKRSSTQSK
jgi:hypothetical protein